MLKCASQADISYTDKEGILKKQFAVLLLLGWLIPAGTAWAESPILVSHTLTDFSFGTGSVALGYTLTVRNSGPGSISNLTLFEIPLSIISRDEITFRIESLEPQTEVHLPLTITTPMILDHYSFLQLPLFWAGRYTDMSGNMIEYSVRSYEGGAL